MSTNTLPNSPVGLSRSVWTKILVLTGLMFWLFYPVSLHRLWLKTSPLLPTGDPNWGHTMIIPIIGIYFLYVNRDALLRAQIKPVRIVDWDRIRLRGAVILAILGLALWATGFAAEMRESLVQAGLMVSIVGRALLIWSVLIAAFNWGLGTLVFGILITGYGIWPGQNDYLKDLGMVFAIFGLVLYQCGWEVMKVAWFPIVFLVCGIPWPGLVYSWVASPLQQLAAWVAVHFLSISGVDAELSGTKIFMLDRAGQWHGLNVAEACAGMRSLMTFITVGAAVAFLSDRPLWQKILMTLFAIPIAVFCNVMRVSIQADMDHYISSQLSQGFAHATTGWVILVIPGFLLILGTGWFLDQLFIDEATAEQTAKKKSDDLIVRIPRPNREGT
ncbi:MAG TPA: exosortase/archaeosortase family protein [Tepidisphaeraceae bacterium]